MSGEVLDEWQRLLLYESLSLSGSGGLQWLFSVAEPWQP